MKHLCRLFGRAALGLPVLLFLGGDGYAAEMKKLTVNVRQIGGTTEMALLSSAGKLPALLSQPYASPIIPSSTGLCVKVLSRNFYKKR